MERNTHHDLPRRARRFPGALLEPLPEERDVFSPDVRAKLKVWTSLGLLTLALLLLFAWVQWRDLHAEPAPAVAQPQLLLGDMASERAAFLEGIAEGQRLAQSNEAERMHVAYLLGVRVGEQAREQAAAAAPTCSQVQR